jgi:hypothetical protein
MVAELLFLLVAVQIWAGVEVLALMEPTHLLQLVVLVEMESHQQLQEHQHFMLVVAVAVATAD